MAGLNLLPWRERERERKKKEFFGLLGLTFAVGGGAVFLAYTYMSTAIANQQARNEYLNSEISVLDKSIEKIKSLDSTRKALLDRMVIIEDLQGTRPAIVHLFDEMATALPEGMYLTNLTQDGLKIHVEGKAESNARVSSYMNRLDQSQWLSSSNLNLISVEKQGKEGEGKLRDFKLDVDQKIRQAKEPNKNATTTDTTQGSAS